jgi:hypothetical protein
MLRPIEHSLRQRITTNGATRHDIADPLAFEGAGLIVALS